MLISLSSMAIESFSKSTPKDGSKILVPLTVTFELRKSFLMSFLEPKPSCESNLSSLCLAIEIF